MHPANARVLFLDLVGGASGDMLISALVDAGASLDVVREAIAAVGLRGVTVESEIAHPAGLRARRIRVRTRHGVEQPAASPTVIAADGVPVETSSPPAGSGPGSASPAGKMSKLRVLAVKTALRISTATSSEHRPYRVIRDRLLASALEPAVKDLALEAFRRLAIAEGEAHGVDPLEVEFHEVGSDDAIADIVGFAAALHALSPALVMCSPVPLGRGLTRGAHGPIPLPGPATLALLRDIPVVGVELQGETVTPTGAALIAASVHRYGAPPAMVLRNVGVGAGSREWPDRPNIVRAILGDQLAPNSESSEDIIVEATIDDMTPAHAASLCNALLATGAHDVWSHPVSMKKGRTGIIVSALVRRTQKEVIASLFFEHTTTLGVRLLEVARIRAERHMESVETPFGVVRIKLSPRPNGPPMVSPEFDDCERLAQESHVSARAVAEAALKAAWSRPQGAGPT